MYFRTKAIKGTPLVQLVESYRNAEGSPRQRVVASLGENRRDAEVAEGRGVLGRWKRNHEDHEGLGRMTVHRSPVTGSYHLTAAAAQVRPAPKATRMM